MENRWLVLLVTVVISAVSYTLAHKANIIPATIELAWKWMKMVPSIDDLTQGLAINFLSGFLRNSLPVCALLWFIPIALRLGSIRTIIWLGCVSGGAWLAASMRKSHPNMDWDFLYDALPVLAPGIALIGKRTSPWNTILAAAAYIVALYFWPFTTTAVTLYFYPLSTTTTATAGLQLSLPYAAILIFGTKLIPKKPETVATSD